MKTLLRGLLFTLITSFNAQSQEATPLNILFIGNSYTHMNSMPVIFDKIAKAKGKAVHVEMSTHSGFSFKQHSEREDMYQAIASRAWDYVILQGYSREFTHPYATIDTASIPYINGIIDTIKANNACTQVLFYMTWGYKNGYQEDPRVDNYTQMADTIADGYTYISDYFNVPLVPAGMVWKKVRNEFPGINLYDADMAHPNKNGSYLVACTFYTAIFRESPVGVFTKTIDASNAKAIQNAAAEYVLPQIKKYKLDYNTWDVGTVRTRKGEYLANFSSYFPNAVKLEWNFGDGNVADKPIVSHVYRKPGQYKVELMVEDSCGMRNYYKNIVFISPEKPLPVPATKPKKKSSGQRKI